MSKKIFSIIIPVVVIAILIACGLWYQHYKTIFPSTDDAYTQAHVVNIAPRVSGKVAEVFIHQNQHVTKGKLLFSLDKEPFKLAVDESIAKLDQIKDKVDAAQMGVNGAQAKLNQAKAELTNTELTNKRTQALVKQGYASKAAGDDAVKNLRVAQQSVSAAFSEYKQAMNQRGVKGPENAQLKAAEASLAQSQLNLSYTDVRAPASGYIENFDLRHGAVLSAFQQAFALVEDGAWWVSANFKETDIERIRRGQQVKIKVDIYPKHVYRGKVLSLSSSSSTSFSLLPAENSSANWVKVTQRFPVRILITESSAELKESE